MTDEPLSAYMDATAPLLGLRIEPAWRDAVRAASAAPVTARKERHYMQVSERISE